MVHVQVRDGRCGPSVLQSKIWRWAKGVACVGRGCESCIRTDAASGRPGASRPETNIARNNHGAGIMGTFFFAEWHYGNFRS